MNFEQLRLGRGYDHNWVLRGDLQEELSGENVVASPSLGHAAILVEMDSGRIMNVYTDQPGQFYGATSLMDPISVLPGGGIDSAKRLHSKHSTTLTRQINPASRQPSSDGRHVSTDEYRFSTLWP